MSNEISRGSSAQSAPAIGKQAHTPAAKNLQFEFHGNGAEFFRIWIVNVLLSVITLGIYSAWAKVRTKRYFYGNTSLDGHNFDYIASPIAILRGRIIAVALLVVFTICQNFFPIISIVLIFLAVCIIPFVLIRAYMFNARNSVYRSIRFGYEQSYKQAAKVIILWPILAAITFGLLGPSMMIRREKLITEGHRFGKTPFKLNASTGDVWKIVLPMIGLVILLSIVFAFLSQVLMAGFSAGGMETAFFMIIIQFVFLSAYLFVMAYITVGMMNLRFSNLTLGSNVFKSNYRVMAWLGLLITNTLAIVLTLGLATPWAMVRVARYRLEHTQLIARDLDSFVANKSKFASATGDEIGEAFDLGFGI